MKTTWNDFWDSNNIAPFSSMSVGLDILKYSNNCPIYSVGTYLTQSDKSISLLEVTKIEKIENPKYDIQITFKFIKKINIRSYDFNEYINKFATNYLFYLEKEIIEKHFEEFKILKTYISDKDQGINEIRDKTNSYKTTISTKILNPEIINPNNWVEFEKICAFLFNILGFVVSVEGHKKEMERVPDMLCYSPPSVNSDERICIVIDCKNKENYYINATDERAMKEYVKKQKSTIYQQGIKAENIYFLFVVNTLSNDTKIKISDIASEQKVTGAIINFNNLIYLVERKLKTGFKFYIENFKNLFRNDEIIVKNIDYVYKIEDEFKI